MSNPARQLKQAEKQRDEYERISEVWKRKYNEILAERDALRDALIPFAEEAERWNGVTLSEADLEISVAIDSYIGDFFRARAAIAGPVTKKERRHLYCGECEAAEATLVPQHNPLCDCQCHRGGETPF